MAILPWSKKKDQPTEAIAVREPEQETSLVPRQNSDIVIHKKDNGAIVQIRTKEIAINGEKRKVDPYQLIRMVRRITQEIGSYKMDNNIAAEFMIRALRKARGDIVSMLEEEFSIKWQINEENGKSTFYV